MSARKSIRTSRFVEILESRVHLSLPGDANGDHRVDSLDFAAVAVNFNASPRTLAQGDFNGDARVNALDFGVLATNFGRQDVPLTVNNYTAGASGDENTWETGANWSLGHKPLSTENATINAVTASAMPVVLTLTETIGQLTITDGDANDFTASGTLNILGDVAATNCGVITLGAVGGSVTGEGNLGQLTIASLTGVGKDLDVVASSVVVTSFAAGADYTIGGSTPALDNLTINGGTATSIVRFTGGSQGGSEGASINNWHGTIVSNKVGATACAVNLGGSTLPADATLTSQLNGVTVTDGTGGTINTFTQLRTAAAQAKYATVPGGVEKSHAFGSTYTVSYAEAFTAFGYVPTGFFGNVSFENVVVDTVAKTVTATIPSTLSTNEPISLTDFDAITFLNVDTITVVAAASGPKQNKLNTGLSLGL